MQLALWPRLSLRAQGGVGSELWQGRLCVGAEPKENWLLQGPTS